MAEENRKYAVPHPQWKDFPTNLPPNTLITRMTRTRTPIPPHPALTILEFPTPTPSNTLIRTYRHANTYSPLPLFIYMHGGGFVTGSLDTDERICRALALALPVLVVSVEYRLAPEWPFPAGLEDCWEVLLWASSSPGQKDLNTNPTKSFILGGTSAGANFTAVLAHRYHHTPPSLPHPHPPLTSLLFLAGSYCHPAVLPPHLLPHILSVNEVTSAPGLSASSITYFYEKYGSPPKDDIRYSPLLHAEESWNEVAQKAYFAICGWDPRRDEGIVFAGILRGQGLEVRERVYVGLPHGFWTTCPDLEVSWGWERDCVEGVGWLLGEGGDGV